MKRGKLDYDGYKTWYKNNVTWGIWLLEEYEVPDFFVWEKEYIDPDDGELMAVVNAQCVRAIPVRFLIQE